MPTSPESGFSLPIIISNKVDLPVPFAPTIPDRETEILTRDYGSNHIICSIVNL